MARHENRLRSGHLESEKYFWWATPIELFRISGQQAIWVGSQPQTN